MREAEGVSGRAKGKRKRDDDGDEGGQEGAETEGRRKGEVVKRGRSH